MGLSLAHFAQHQVASGANAVTVTVPANAAVGIITLLSGGFGMGYHQGTVTDSGGNTYTAAGGANSGGTTFYCDAFYCLNTGSTATTVTYTPSASYTSLFLVFSVVWVWTVSAGSASIGSQNNSFQSAAGTGTDAVTTGSVTCSTGSVIMGFSYDNGTGTETLGTGFTSDFNSFGAFAEHGAFSASQAATWTESTATVNIISQAMSFGFSGGVITPTAGPLALGSQLPTLISGTIISPPTA